VALLSKQLVRPYRTIHLIAMDAISFAPPPNRACHIAPVWGVDDTIITDLAAEFVLSPVRVFEVLLWTEVEERGHYR
jgi:hypothetical protein